MAKKKVGIQKSGGSKKVPPAAPKKAAGRPVKKQGTTSATKKGAVHSPAKSSNGKAGLGHYSARVRMYRQGLGDCFLLTFPKLQGGDFHILIDCGVILGTPNPGPIMKQVVSDIISTTSNHLDVLVATHEHWDHVSGFYQVKDLFDDKEFKVDRVWLAWTEDPHDKTANQIRHDRAQKVAALWLGIQKIQSMAIDTKLLPPSLEPAAEVLSFFGIDPSSPFPKGSSFGVQAAAAADGGVTGAAMKWVREKIATPEFWTPGQSIDLSAELGIHVHVLGPPTDMSFMSKTLPTKSGHETYEDKTGKNQAGTDAQAFMAAAFGADGSDSPLSELPDSLPFDSKYRIPKSDAAEIDFFREHYWGADGHTEEWRRIDGQWMTGAAEFALQLDGETNNTSLALAFQLDDGRVLLFPGDAQVGNWESWHVDGDKPRVWNVKSGQKTVQFTAEQLLNRTVVYKVGHHGSHNATLRELGLEMMTDPCLVALVPVDVHIAHDKKRWGQMPFQPLMDRLDTKTHHQTIQADVTVASAGKPAEFADSTEMITVDGPGGTPVTRPLYVDYFVPKH